MSTETKQPWWQLTRTPTSGFVLAATWTIAAVLRWWPPGPDGTLGLVAGCLFTVLAVAHLASATASLRRERAQARRISA